MTDGGDAAKLRVLGKHPEKMTPVLLDLDLAGAGKDKARTASTFRFVHNVDVSGNDLEHLTFLSQLQDLRRVKATNNRLTRFLDMDQAPRSLESVDLSNNDIAEFGDDVGRHKHLQEVIVRHNQVRSLVPLRQLKFVRHLDIAHNHVYLIKSIDHLPLCFFNAAHNKHIMTVADLDPMPTLQVLDLTDNNLQDLRGIDKHQHLAEILVAQNQIRTLDDVRLMSQLGQLRTLDLSGNPVQQMEHYRHEVLYILPLLDTLDGEPVSPEDVVAAANFHGDNEQQLRAIHDHFLPKGGDTRPLDFEQSLAHDADDQLEPSTFWARLAECGFFQPWQDFLWAVKANQPERINLSDVHLGEVGLRTVTDAVEENGCLRQLDLSGTHHTNRWTAQFGGAHRYLGLADLCGAMSAPEAHITWLSLAHCSLGHQAATIIAQFIGRSDHLQFLDVSSNRLGDSIREQNAKQIVAHCPGLRALLGDIVGSPSLTSLDLSNNQIGSSGAEFLAQNLKSEALTLQFLSLADNPISQGGQGGRHVCEAMRFCRSLVCLDLRGALNGPDDFKALEALGHSLKQNQTLQVLNVSDNNCGDWAAEAFATSLKLHNRKLIRLNMANSRIQQRGRQLLQDAHQANDILQTLILDDNTDDQRPDNDAQEDQSDVLPESNFERLLSSVSSSRDTVVDVSAPLSVAQKQRLLSCIALNSDLCRLRQSPASQQGEAGSQEEDLVDNSVAARLAANRIGRDEADFCDPSSHDDPVFSIQRTIQH